VNDGVAESSPNRHQRRPPAALEPDRYLSAALFGLTVFGLELVVVTPGP